MWRVLRIFSEIYLSGISTNVDSELLKINRNIPIVYSITFFWYPVVHARYIRELLPKKVRIPLECKTKLLICIMGLRLFFTLFNFEHDIFKFTVKRVPCIYNRHSLLYFIRKCLGMENVQQRNHTYLYSYQHNRHLHTNNASLYSRLITQQCIATSFIRKLCRGRPWAVPSNSASDPRVPGEFISHAVPATYSEVLHLLLLFRLPYNLK